MTKEMNNKTITQLTPYVGDNFIEFPLWEQGHWIPQLTFWQKFENEDQACLFFNHLKKICGLAYKCEFDRMTESTSNIFHIYIMPSYQISDTDEVKYNFMNWTIEEMVYLAIKAIKFNNKELV